MREKREKTFISVAVTAIVCSCRRRDEIHYQFKRSECPQRSSLFAILKNHQTSLNHFRLSIVQLAPLLDNHQNYWCHRHSSPSVQLAAIIFNRNNYLSINSEEIHFSVTTKHSNLMEIYLNSSMVNIIPI